MKKYITPNANIVMLLTEDVITASNQGLSVASGNADFSANTYTLDDGFWG